MPGRARVMPKYPVRTIGGPGISAIRENGDVTYALDIGELDELADLTGVSLSETFVAVELSDGSLRKVSLQTIIDAA